MNYNIPVFWKYANSCFREGKGGDHSEWDNASEVSTNAGGGHKNCAGHWYDSHWEVSSDTAAGKGLTCWFIFCKYSFTSIGVIRMDSHQVRM